MEDNNLYKKKKEKCWKFFQCKKSECPAYNSEDLRCWLFSGTHCRDEIQGKFFEKMEICLDCEVFKRNMDIHNVQETFRLINRQLKEYKRLVNDRDKELQQLATTDPLTKAYNRTKFDEIIKREIQKFKRYDESFSLILFDIDDFKDINDKYGHNIGDHVLQKVTSLAKNISRQIDYVIRWGGEEFMIISPKTNLEKAHVFAERLRKAIESYEFEKVGQVTASFGVTEIKKDDTENTFVKRADRAMYQAKIKGKNRVERSN